MTCIIFKFLRNTTCARSSTYTWDKHHWLHNFMVLVLPRIFIQPLQLSMQLLYISYCCYWDAALDDLLKELICCNCWYWTLHIYCFVFFCMLFRQVNANKHVYNLSVWIQTYEIMYWSKKNWRHCLWRGNGFLPSRLLFNIWSQWRINMACHKFTPQTLQWVGKYQHTKSIHITWPQITHRC